MDKMPKEGNADVLFARLKNLGLRYAAAPHLTVRDGRLIEYSLERKRFDTAAESAEDFAQWLSRMFSLGPMEKKGNAYEARNPSAGWRAVVKIDGVQFFTLPILDDKKE
ncbi:MAG: hypothetical protein LBQ10_04545 [Desulfovibrio sp.]|jgi:hypothetical protein|nr:hypothetical protein [Desulfovibrio sp.]